MLKIKRPLVVIALVFILSIIIYDNVNPPEEAIYSGKFVSITGKVVGISTYSSQFGERSIRLQIKGGPKELSAFLVKIKEGKLISSCKINDNKSKDTAVLLKKELYGRRIRCRGIFESFEEPSNSGQFNSKLYYKNAGFLGIIRADEIKLLASDVSPDIYFHKLNLNISEKYKKILGEKNAGSLSAMILGDKSNLDEEIKELYQENSISHLLAISGLHISLVGGAIYLFLKKMRVSFKFPLISASIMLIMYGIFTGFSVSTIRAVIMMCMFFFSLIIGKSYDLPSGLAFSAIIILLFNHRAIYQSGFQLSFLAVIGIFYIMPELMYVLKIHDLNKTGIKKVLYIILSSMICSISINIATLPVVLMNFYEISLLGIVLNIIVIPLMSVLVITGLIGGFISLIAEMAGSFVLGVAYYILNLYTWLCKIGDNLVFCRIILGKPEIWQIIAYYILLIIIFGFLSMKRRNEKIQTLKNSNAKINTSKRVLITFLTLTFTYLILVYRKEEFSLNMLDIGQGDCFVINDGDKNIYISDCGSTTVNNVGKSRLLPFLKSKGWGRIDTIFVSHMDKDHVNGINDLLKCPEIIVERVVISVSYKSDKLKCNELEELKTLTRQRNIRLLYMKKGDEIKGNGLTFKCLYPSGTENIEDQNEASIVMRMDYNGISALFTGDIASTTEEEVMKNSSKEILDCDILKVCHHGSKNSSSAGFLEKVNPKLYLISCGLMNRYGHPHKATLERIGTEGGKIFRTDHMGEVEVKLNKGKIAVRYNSKKLLPKQFIPAKECDCEDCRTLKVNVHLNYKNNHLGK